MKLHLPCKLLTAVLACFCVASSYTQAAESININFSNNNGNKVAADTAAGLEAVNGQYWNQYAAANGSNEALTAYNGTESVASTAVLEWSSATLWGDSAFVSAVQKGYLDDGGSGAAVRVSHLDYMLYDVYVYAATDSNDKSYRPVTVNGVTYTYDAISGTTTGDAEWGSTIVYETTLGQNALKIEGQTASPLLVNGGVMSDTARGGIAGIQIVDATVSVLWTSSSTEALGADSSFTLGDATKTLSAIVSDVDAGRRYVGLSNQALSLSSALALDGVQATAGASTVSGSDLSIGILFAKQGATLDVTGTLAEESDLTIGGNGTVQFSVDQSFNNLTLAGNLHLTDNVEVVLNGSYTHKEGFITAGTGASMYIGIANDVAYTQGDLTVTVSAGGAKSDLIGTAVGEMKLKVDAETALALSSAGGTLTITGGDATVSSLELTGGTTVLRAADGAALAGNFEGNLAGGQIHEKNLTVGNGVSLTISAIDLGTSNLTLEEGGTISTDSLIASNGWMGRTSNINVNGGLFEVTGTTDAANLSNNWGKGGSVRLSHWDGATTLNINGGEFRVLGAIINTSDDGHSSININSGSMNVKGLRMKKNADSLTMTGGALHIGAGGIISGQTDGSQGVISLTGGTLGVQESDWSSALNMAVGNVEINTTKYALGEDGTWAYKTGDGSGATITLSGTLTANADTNLTVSGTGTVKITGANTVLHDVTNNGTLELAGKMTGSLTNASGASAKINGAFTVEGAADDVVHINGTASSSSAVTVNGGTLKVTAGNSGTAFTKGEVTINGGGILLLTKKDSMGYDGGRTTTITLAGGETGTATLKVGGRQTMQTNIVMQGNALITAATAEEAGSLGTGDDRPSLNPFKGGGISVSGTNNEISVAIAEREAVSVDVAAEGELSLTGGFYNQSDSGIITKTGAGLLKIDTSTLTADRTISHGLTLSAGSLETVGTLTITNLTTAAGTTMTNSGTLTLAGTTALGAAIINSGEDASITFASGALLDMADMACTQDGNTYVYTLTTTGSTVNDFGLANLTNITTEGKNWDFSTLATNGTFSYTLDNKTVTGSGELGEWTNGTTMGDDSFSNGDNVEFSGETSTTLGDNVSAGSVTVSSGTTTLTQGESSNVLTADEVSIASGATLALSGTGVLDAAHLNVEEGGRLEVTNGSELASGTTVSGTGTLVLNLESETRNLSIVNGFEGNLEIATGTYKHDVQGEWDSLNSLVVTGTGKALFFGLGTGGDYDGTIVVKDLAEGHKEALKLDGGKVTGEINIASDVNIYNQWDGELYSALTGEGSVTFTGGNSSYSVHVGSDASELTGDIIVDSSCSTIFKGKDDSGYGAATIANDGKFIVRNGNVSVYSAINSTDGVEVESGKTLNISSADQNNSFALEGGTVNLAGSTMNGTVTLSGDTSSVITGNDADLKSAISGEGDLTLKGSTGALHVYSEMDFTGDLKVTAGTVNLGSTAQADTNIHHTGDIVIEGATASTNNGAKLANSGNVNITSGSLTVNNGTSIANTNGAINVQGGSLVVKEGADIGTAAVNVTSGRMQLEGEETFVLSNSSVTVGQDATLALNTGLAVAGSLTLADGAKLDLTGFDLSAQTFSGNGTAVLGAQEGLSVGSITLTGTPEGAAMGLSLVDNTLYASELTALAVTGVKGYNTETQTLTLSTNMDVTHLFGDVTCELDGLTIGELGQQVIDAVGDWGTMLNLSFQNANGVTINLSGLTGLTINDYSGENFAVSADGSSVGSYAAYMIPEPTTATLSLLALAGLAARRRRK